MTRDLLKLTRILRLSSCRVAHDEREFRGRTEVLENLGSTHINVYGDRVRDFRPPRSCQWAFRIDRQHENLGVEPRYSKTSVRPLLTAPTSRRCPKYGLFKEFDCTICK